MIVGGSLPWALALLTTNVIASSPFRGSHRSRRGFDGYVANIEKHAIKPSEFVFGHETPVKGVNLGGWLLLEPFITPSLFDATDSPDVVDEWTLGQFYGSRAPAVLKHHWDTFVTAQDFQTIKSYGLNLVRIPIGYWAFDVSEGEPFPQGQLPYLRRAVMWAKQSGLHVTIDLHGAPGSQNAFDNSGHRGHIGWNLTGTNNIQRTLSVLKNITDEFSDPFYGYTVAAIEALNEPAGYKGAELMTTVQAFYKDAYSVIRSSERNFQIIFHDAFKGFEYWKELMPRNVYQGVTFSIHPYFIFNERNIHMEAEQRIRNICQYNARIAKSEKYHSSLVGEFSTCVTDCAKYVNGRGIGSRYSGSYAGEVPLGSCVGKSGSASTFSPEYKAYLGRFWEVQARTFSSGSGWMMWTWKTEPGAAEDLSYSAGVANGWIPRNPTDYRYPDPCA